MAKQRCKQALRVLMQLFTCWLYALALRFVVFECLYFTEISLVWVNAIPYICAVVLGFAYGFVKRRRKFRLQSWRKKRAGEITAIVLALFVVLPTFFLLAAAFEAVLPQVSNWLYNPSVLLPADLRFSSSYTDWISPRLNSELFSIVNLYLAATALLSTWLPGKLLEAKEKSKT